MTQFARLSAKAQNIVNIFFDSIWNKGFTNNPSMILGASLYAINPDAKSTVVEELDKYIVDLKEELSSEQIDILKNEYTNVILSCFDQDSENFSSNRVNQFTPSGLVDLCLKIAECRPNSEVYLPYNGTGEFSRKLISCKCEGYEQSIINWAISEVVNSAVGVKCNIECVAFPIAMTAKEYDYIFTCPPFAQRREVISSLIHLVETNLKKDGELYAILPFDVCTTPSGGQGFDFRKTAADLNVSIAVLALPTETFQPYTGIKTCLIHIKKDELGNVILADFSSSTFVSRTNVVGRKRYTLKTESIIESLKECDEKLVWCGKYSDLTGSLSLSPNRYLPIISTPILANSEKLVNLGELIERVPATRLAVKAVKPFVGNRELFDDYLNCILSADNTLASVKETNSVIDQDCLLIGFIGGKVKVARLKNATQTNSVSLRSEIFPVKIASSIITEDYLLRSLLCDYSQEQIVKLSTGSVISRISFRDLCDILIKVPSLEEQEKACYNDAHAGIKEADIKLQKAYEDFRKDVHMKKHAIGQTLANFKNWWRLLEQVRKDGNGIIDDNATIGRIHKVSVKEIFENLDTTISKLSTQLNKFDTGYGLLKEDIALTDFIENYILGNRSPLFRYEYNSADHRSIEDIPEVDFDENQNGQLTGNFSLRKGEPIEYIRFPKEALTTIFNNIVSNACAHGFANREDADNIIKIEIGTEGSDYIVSISNNGKPLVPQMSCSDITVYGQTSGNSNTHFGIGGYEIKKLMEEFGDKLEIISEPENEFTVTYRLIFHDTNIDSSFEL